ncbi:DUF86 domain-containing protein [Pigmentiphaga sp. H8]|uniref:HepT-like ribonuclease domain-containing protein n=1 Tax=unclassified Pigmentiphaga TaxID=2626614 RepID=UPI000F5B7C57|nr:DUF86 domain-containing protein [Pigmentiphaga sp. H8]AZG07281.1 DUF86 domain-containing protein [Pigmentiphaga sp. H8]
MTLDQQRLVDYLTHIVEAIERINYYTGGMDEGTFLRDQLVQDAVIRNFEIIGEASNNIEKRYPEFAAAHPELPLSFAYQMRNALAHGYFKVDFEIVWKTIQRSLPGLFVQVREALASITGPDIEGMGS